MSLRSSDLNFLGQFAFLLPHNKFEPHWHASEGIVGHRNVGDGQGKLNKKALRRHKFNLELLDLIVEGATILY